MRDQNGPLEKDCLKDFEWRIIVAGSRGFEDVVLFDEHIWSLLKDLSLDKEEDKKKVVFITGAAKSGADDLIIRWCKKNGYSWVEFHPRWDEIDVEGAVVRTRGDGKQYNLLAGFWRNEEMSEVGNYLITFYDGVSSGTRDMINRMQELEIPCRVVLVHIEKDEKENNHGWKPRRS
jgi:hypothetical protein